MPTENALADRRLEYVDAAFDSNGDPIAPTDPSWSRFSDYIESTPGWQPDANYEATTPVGFGDIQRNDKGPETHDFSLQYQLQRFFVDGSGNAQTPIGEMINHDYQQDYPCHVVVDRRETTEGGNLGGGIRSYSVGIGCYPITAEVPGDPSSGEPVIVQLDYAVSKARPYLIHQPSGTVNPTVVSTSANDTMDITFENEGASTTDTRTLNGTTSVNSTVSFGDFDAIRLSSEPEGDITVTDGNSNTIMEITGSNTDGVEGDLGVPLLGSGSHASTIGTEPLQFLNTSHTFAGGSLADDILGIDWSIEADDERDAVPGTRAQDIDVGARTITADTTTKGEYDTHTQLERHLQQTSGDLVFTYTNTGKVTVVNATPVDSAERDVEAEDANVASDVTFRAAGDPAITASQV